jgi:hypothetical protein
VTESLSQRERDLPEGDCTLDARIEAAETALRALYRERRGARSIDASGREHFWCTVCGADTVNPHAGEDTCRHCLDHG